MKQALVLFFILTILSSCNSNNGSATTPDTSTTNTTATPVINFAVKNYFPHDSALFTEGFLFHNGQLYESTGSPEDLPQTRSVVGITDIATGKFTKKIEIDKSKYFGEGIVFWHDKLYELTYKNQTGFIYDATTFKQTGQFKFANKEGWAFTTDSINLIMSDGTANLTYLDPTNFQPVKTLAVTENGQPEENLNELEFIKGFIYANIYTTNFLVKIDPATGKVVGKMDLTSLYDEAHLKNPKGDVLNGIAYDPATDKIYVTGKMWLNIYQIDFPH
jgi:glutamine cyclotransferase